MNVQLNLNSALTAWAKTQPNAEEAILNILGAHLAAIDTPILRASKLLKQNAKTIPAEMEFEIPQIIGRSDWEALSRSEKLSLGKEVKRDPAVFGLRFLRKNSANHAIYKRLDD